MALLTSKSTAARLLDLLNGAASRVSRSAFAARVAPRAKLHPWTVKWSKRLDSVVIYIPREAVVGKTMNVTRLNPATDAEGNTMPNWYLVDMSKAAVAEEVRVSLYETASGLDVDIASPDSGETPIARVLIARISLPTGSTVTPVVITQIVTSALSLGTGGGGNGMVLGPLEYEPSNSRMVQYMGTWSLTPAEGSGSASWNFIKATDADGRTLPPAVVYSIKTANVLLRQGSSPNETISLVQMPLLFAEEVYEWLSRQTATVTKAVNYTPPGNELENGELSATTSTITYFSASGQLDGETKTLLTTITEDANETTIYESESGEGV